MRALVASPDSPEHIEMREVEEPTPRDDEALVRVQAISLNRGEVHRLAAAQDGTRFGWDIAGVIERQAASGEGPGEGTRVVGFVYNSGWAERVAVNVLKLAPIPDEVTFADASTLPVAGLTALRTLRLGGSLLGRRVLITGASGGVGRFAVQLAALSGANVTAISRGGARAEGLEELGALQVIDEIDAAPGEYDLILESAGGASLASALRFVAPEGLVVTFGNSERRPTTFDVSTFYNREPSVRGFLLLSPYQNQDFRGDLSYLLGLMAGGKLDPQVGYEGSWRESSQALAALRERRVRGKAVLALD